jgi:hypothetical protein
LLKHFAVLLLFSSYFGNQFQKFCIIILTSAKVEVKEIVTMTKFIKDALTSKWLLAVSRLWRDKAKKSKNFKTVESRKLWDCHAPLRLNRRSFAMTKKVGFSVLSNLRDLSRNLRDKVHPCINNL